MEFDIVVIASVLLLFFVVAVITVMLWMAHRQQIAERKRMHGDRAADNASRKLRDARKNLGGRIYNALTRAARDHPGHETREAIPVVGREENNDGNYSVFVRYYEPDVPTHLQATFQVNIPLTENPDSSVRVIEGDCGPANNHPITEESVTSLIEYLEEKTRTWGLSKVA